MSEDEAKRCWCPFARAAVAAGLDVVAGNRPEKEATRCIGSACMAWREEAQMPSPQWVHPDVLRGAWLGWEPTGKADERGYIEITRPSAISRGFCGLAGRPA